VSGELFLATGLISSAIGAAVAGVPWVAIAAVAAAIPYVAIGVLRALEVMRSRHERRLRPF
jgi:Flp pilus assembly secretin CpaC